MATLAVMLGRVRALLVDTGAETIWADSTITEALRLAVGEYSLAGDAVVTLSGLDGSADTTIPLAHHSMIVYGGAAYAAQARAVDRAESYQLGREGTELKSWADARLREYKGMLASIFPGYLAALAGGGNASGAGAGADPALTAAQIAEMLAHAEEMTARAAAITGKEARDEAAAQQAAADRAAEAARLAELRAGAPGWGTWTETGIDYPDGYDRS